MARRNQDAGRFGVAAPMIALFVLLTAVSARAALPTVFDWRSSYGTSLVSGVRSCGSCGPDYIFAPVAMVESRQMIAGWKYGLPATELDYSEQYILSCGTGVHGDFGCGGGNSQDVLTYLRDVGAPLESCFTYKNSDLPCPTDCPDSGGPLHLFQPVTNIQTWISYPGAGMLMSTIYDGGPVAVLMAVYEDFFAYTSGIYAHTTGNYLGTTVVVIVGWGVEIGTEYWIVKHCWGANWGEGGYFRIARANQGNCDFATYGFSCSVGLPAVSAVGPGECAARLLDQNSPNPFNPLTTLRFTAPAAGRIRLAIYDVRGKLVRRLVDADLSCGRHETVWNGRDETGRAVGSGCYFARLAAFGKTETVRMELVR